MGSIWIITVLASILIGCVVFSGVPQAHADTSTLWQIGNIANPNVSPQADGNEFLQTDSHSALFTYNVNSLNPIDDCTTSQCVNFPAQIGTGNNPTWTATTLAKINFGSECYSEALLTMTKYGSEDDLVRLDGVFQGELAGSNENQFISSSVIVGPILQDNTLEIEIDLGSGNNDRHFVEAIVLEVDSDNQITCPELQCVAPPNGMISWWPLDEAPGTGTSVDIIGGLDGTWNGDPTAFGGQVDNALSFDGNGDFVRISNDPSLEPANTITVDAWVRHNGSPGSFDYIVGKGAHGGSSASYALYTGGPGKLFFYVHTNTGTTLSPGATVAQVWDGEWHHVAGTYDGSDVRLYVDGAEIGGGTAKTGNITYNLSTSNDLLIGMYDNGNSLFSLHGDVDEVEIFDRALSQVEIQAIADAGSAGKCKVPPNQDPVCDAAEPSETSLWPPNHKFVDISVSGVTDPDDDGVTITVTEITQDEAVDAKGSGKTAPDGEIDGDSAKVRAERSGKGDGRAYEISFTADDGNGGMCSGSVSVGVPHDKKSTAVDSGQNFDSTQP